MMAGSCAADHPARCSLSLAPLKASHHRARLASCSTNEGPSDATGRQRDAAVVKTGALRISTLFRSINARRRERAWPYANALQLGGIHKGGGFFLTTHPSKAPTPASIMLYTSYLFSQMPSSLSTSIYTQYNKKIVRVATQRVKV